LIFFATFYDFFDTSFQKNVRSHVFLKSEKNVNYVFPNTDSHPGWTYTPVGPIQPKAAPLVIRSAYSWIWSSSLPNRRPPRVLLESGSFQNVINVYEQRRLLSRGLCVEKGYHIRFHKIRAMCILQLLCLSSCVCVKWVYQRDSLASPGDRGWGGRVEGIWGTQVPLPAWSRGTRHKFCS